MEVRNLIKPSSTVVQITEIGKGDIYKRLEESPYSETKVVYGVVIDVLNNGEQSSLVTLEFSPVAYSSDIKAVTKVFSGTSSVAIFPAQEDEYRLALSEAIDAQSREVEKSRNEYQRKQAVLEHMLEAEGSVLTTAKVQAVQA